MSREQRHANMAAIKGRDTKPEMVVRRWLWSRGYRYRLNHRHLPGKPDLVLRKYRTCIFVNGCFWHGHEVTEECLTALLEAAKGAEGMAAVGEGRSLSWGSACCHIPHTNTAFWVEKIRRNRERDREVQVRLAEMGWHCITVWECELRGQKRLVRTAENDGQSVPEVLMRVEYLLNRFYLEDCQRFGKRKMDGHAYEMGEEEMTIAAEDC